MIASPANPHVKRIRSLAADRKERRRERLFVLEGVRLVADALEHGGALDLALYAPDQLDQTAAGRELRARLERRGEDAPDVIDLRLRNAALEMEQACKFDFVIINEVFERALFDLKTIVHAQRLKYAAQRRARAETFASLNIP